MLADQRVSLWAGLRGWAVMGPELVCRQLIPGLLNGKAVITTMTYCAGALVVSPSSMHPTACTAAVDVDCQRLLILHAMVYVKCSMAHEACLRLLLHGVSLHMPRAY